jgi:enoyl-CoA hydratase
MQPQPTIQTLHEHLHEERHDAVALLRIHRPQSLGALNRGMVAALGDYFHQIAGDATVRALVITGTGRGFVAGADITEYHQASQDDFDTYQRLSRRTFDALEALPQISIAAINGWALGGGFELALCCDLILAARSARLGLPELRLGLIPGGGGTQRLTRTAGPRLTKMMLITGEPVPANDLVSSGVVNRVVDDDDLVPTALQIARSAATGPPSAIRAAKRVVDQGAALPLSDALTLEQDTLSTLFTGADAKEGIRAFVEKRPARWEGM